MARSAASALAGAVVAGIAGWQALSGGLRILAAPGPLWAADLDAWTATAPAGAWQAPVALVLLAVAAAAALPRPRRVRRCRGLRRTGHGRRTGGARAALVVAAADRRRGRRSATGWPPWPPPIRAPRPPGPGSPPRWRCTPPVPAWSGPWTTAVALGVIAVIGTLVAGLARSDLNPVR